MSAYFDEDNDLWELAELYIDLFPPRRRAKQLTDLNKVEFRAWFLDFGVL